MERVAAEVSSPGAPGFSLRGALVGAFRNVMRLYFRRIERVGHAPTADTHSRVFVSNHNNGLIDPILVITDAACEISPIAKSTLWSVPGLKWLLDHAGAVPIVRRKDAPDKDASANAEVFARIATHLARGGNILIFPEGTSHSEPQLAPLRSGAARMLEAAQAVGRRCDVPGRRARVRPARRLPLALPDPVGTGAPVRRPARRPRRQGRRSDRSHGRRSARAARRGRDP